MPQGSPDEREETPLGQRVDARTAELLREPTLWPVWLVLIGHAVAFGAALVLLAVRDRHPAALGGLLLLGLLTLFRLAERLRAGRGPGPIEGLLLAVWGLSAATAWLADRYGVF